MCVCAFPQTPSTPLICRGFREKKYFLVQLANLEQMSSKTETCQWHRARGAADVALGQRCSGFFFSFSLCRWLSLVQQHQWKIEAVVSWLLWLSRTIGNGLISECAKAPCRVQKIHYIQMLGLGLFWIAFTHGFLELFLFTFVLNCFYSHF